MTRTLADAPAGSGLAPVPGDGGLPLLGHGLDYLRDPMRLWQTRYQRYGRVSWFRAFGTRIVALLGPEAS
ncbi:MAG TPA: cytochrome P450, partial [Dietzia sp.]|nr:cytochrome P450 [Dietzia sp.]